MPRRIEVELTSVREDGTWTWRAAGARQPKGTLDGGLLHQGAKVGDVVRADADFDVEGITITSVLPPKSGRQEPERLEILGAPVRDDQLVTSTLAPKRRGERGDRDGRRGRRDDRDGGGRGDRPRRDGDRPRGERTGRPEGERGERRPRPERSSRPARPAPEAKPKPKRLRPGRTHRTAVLESLPEEERPIAEQVLRGGIPAVRQAVDKQNEQARADGHPEVKAEPLVGIAERLLPRLRTAEWRDRADAALAAIDELDLRDLRSVVVAADTAARDDETRAIATQLRDGLNHRVEAEHAAWLAELRETVADGRVVRALRLSSRPPKAGAPLPAELATALATAAGEAFAADVTQERWATVLDAVAYSPVRQQVVPAAIPAEPNEALLAAVRKLASRVPEIAARLGVQASDAPKRGRRGGAKGGGRTPPPPPAPVLDAPPAGPDAAEAPPEPASEAPDAAVVDTTEAPAEASAVAADVADAIEDAVEDAAEVTATPETPAPEAATAEATPADSEPAAPAPEAEVAAPEAEAAAPEPEAPEPDAVASDSDAPQSEASAPDDAEPAGTDADEDQPSS